MGTGHGSAFRGFPAAPLLSPDNPGELVLGDAHLAKPGRGPRGTVLVRPPDVGTTQLHNGLPFGAPPPGALAHAFPEVDGHRHGEEPRDEMRTTAPTNTLPPAAALPLTSTAPGMDPAPPPRFEPNAAPPAFDPPPRIEATPLPQRSSVASVSDVADAVGSPPVEVTATPATPFERVVAPPSFEPAPPARVEVSAIPPQFAAASPPPATPHAAPVAAPHAVTPPATYGDATPPAYDAAFEPPPVRAPRMTVPHTSQHADARGSLPSAPSNPSALPFAPAGADDAREGDGPRPAPGDASPWARERHVLPAVADPAAYAQSLPAPRVAPAQPKPRTGIGLMVGLGVGLAFLVVAVISGIWWLGRSRSTPDHPVAAPSQQQSSPAAGDRPEGTGTAHLGADVPATARPIEIPVPTVAPRPHGSIPGSADVEPAPPPTDDKRFQPEGI